jgi:hypothetical protein
MKIVYVPTGVLPEVPITRVARLHPGPGTQAATGSETEVGLTVAVRPGMGLPPTSGSNGARSTQLIPKQVNPLPSFIAMSLVLVTLAPAKRLKLEVVSERVKNG